MDEMKYELNETSLKPMTTLVSAEFETKALEQFGQIENVSTHYRDLLRNQNSEEQEWYASMQGRHGEVYTIETAAMKRSRDFLVVLADEMARKRGNRIYRKVFVGWRIHVFRYIFLRDQILQNYILNTYLARRFYAWRLVARRSQALALCIKSCWRRRREHRFSWWIHSTRWNALKLKLHLRVFRVLKNNSKLQKVVRRRWQAIGNHKRRDWAARKIQMVQRWHAPRRTYHARKLIKYWFMLKFGMKLLKRRRREELRRAEYENETSDILVRRALENLDGLLNDEGSVILSQYLRSVNGVSKQIETAQPGTLLSKAKLFPTPKEAPEFAKLWTVRAKAMAVLRMRCTAEVVRLARRRFRQTSPCLYECKRCAVTFLIRQEKLHHQMNECPFKPFEEDVEDEDYEIEEGNEGDPDHERSDWESSVQNKGGLQVMAKATKRWRQRLKAKTKGYGVSEDNMDELDRDYICWKLAAPIVEAALQPLAAYLTKQKPHPGGVAYVLRRDKQ